MSTFKFDKEKYLDLVKAEGVPAALSALHHDTIEWEFQAFEGDRGYQPKMWAELQDVREFSRELWEIALRKEAQSLGKS
jgi:hypothetical protein